MKKKILIVDDSNVTRTFLANLLEREGHEVSTAIDGYSALNILVNYIPDIIFMDLFMPIIAGDKLCQMIRKMSHLNDCFLVIISGAVAEMDFDYTQFGADRCIAKGPFGKMAEHVLAAVSESGTLRWKDKSEPIVGLDDVYAREMTKELLDRYHHLETILESIGEGIMEVKAGIIVWANAAAASLFKRGQEDLLARSFADLFGSKDLPRIQALLKPDAGEPADIGTASPVTVKDRQLAIKRFSKKGKTTSSIMIIRDVTHQNRMDFNLQHACKLDFAAKLAKGVAKLLQKQLKRIQQIPPDPAQNPPAKIEGYAREIQELIGQLYVLNPTEKRGLTETDEPIKTGTETILLVDSNKVVCIFNRLLLEDLGYKILVAATGEEAFEKYKIRSHNQYNKIDLVIIDIRLPDMDAGALCDRLKALNPGVKLIMAAQASPNDRQTASIIQNVNGFIKTPFNVHQVSSSLRKILDF